MGGGEAFHEGRVAAHEAAGVDGGAAVRLGERLGFGHPAGGGGQGGAAVPVVEAGMGGLATHVEPPFEHPPAAGHEGLRVARGLSRLQHPEGPRRLSPAADGGLRERSSHLLVRHHHQQEIGRGLLPAVAEEVQGSHEGGETPFHVDGAGGDQPVAFQMGLHRGENGVEMADQQEVIPRGVRPSGVEDGERGRIRGRRFVADLGRETALAQGRRKVFCRKPEPRRIAAVRGDAGQLAQKADSPLQERLRKDRDSGLHGGASLPQTARIPGICRDLARRRSADGEYATPLDTSRRRSGSCDACRYYATPLVGTRHRSVTLRLP